MSAAHASGAGLDIPAEVRAGEELPSDSLRAHLEAAGLGTGGALHVRQFPRGFSNLTYLLEWGDRQMVLRRPPYGVSKGSAHDMAREFRILTALSAAGYSVPRPLHYSEDERVLGAPFYVMERVAGVILRDRPPAGLSLDASTMRRLSEAFIDALAELHALDYRAAGLAELGRPEGYVTRQVAGWTRRWQAARTGEQTDVEALAAWLAAHVPPERGVALIHNDFKYDNLVLDPGDLSRIVAVLDWEMATVGDPLMDLGTSLAYWVEATDPPEIRALGIGITALSGNLTRAELVARYAERTGRPVPDVAFYHAFGLFKVAVIAQQIFARYVRGFTRDARFARLDRVVAALGQAGARAFEAAAHP